MRVILLHVHELVFLDLVGFIYGSTQWLKICFWRVLDVHFLVKHIFLEERIVLNRVNNLFDRQKQRVIHESLTHQEMYILVKL